jgi:hypothetical protein
MCYDFKRQGIKQRKPNGITSLFVSNEWEPPIFGKFIVNCVWKLLIALLVLFWGYSSSWDRKEV